MNTNEKQMLLFYYCFLSVLISSDDNGTRINPSSDLDKPSAWYSNLYGWMYSFFNGFSLVVIRANWSQNDWFDCNTQSFKSGN